MSIHVLEVETSRDHQDLGLVEQLGDLLGGPLGALVLGGHPGLGRLLDDLLTDEVDPALQGHDGGRTLRARLRLLPKLGEQLFERLHGKHCDNSSRDRYERPRQVRRALGCRSWSAETPSPPPAARPSSSPRSRPAPPPTRAPPRRPPPLLPRTPARLERCRRRRPGSSRSAPTTRPTSRGSATTSRATARASNRPSRTRSPSVWATRPRT